MENEKLRVEVERIGRVANFPPLRAVSMVRQLVVALDDDGLASPFLSSDVIKFLDGMRKMLLRLETEEEPGAAITSAYAGVAVWSAPAEAFMATGKKDAVMETMEALAARQAARALIKK